MANYFNGIIAPVLVPSNLDGSINEERFIDHLQFLIDKGVAGLFIGGTSGEFVNYTDEDRMHLLELAVKNTSGAKLLYNVTAMNREKLKLHVDFADKFGIEAVSVTAPYYHKYDKEALVQYIAEVSKMTEGKALFVYNMPGMTGNPFTLDMVGAMREVAPNLKGIKDSSMVFTNLEEFLFNAPEDFEVITGNDADVVASFVLGCKGAIVALANVCPEFFEKMLDYISRGDVNQALVYQEKIIKLRYACRSTMPIMSHKYLLKLRGRDMGYAHFPMRNLNEKEKALLETVAAEVNLYEF